MTIEPVRMTYREAIRQSIREAMLADERVFLMGEDVGAYGGCFAVSKELLEEFGQTDPRHSIVRIGLCGDGNRRRDERDAADCRDHDGELQSARA